MTLLRVAHQDITSIAIDAIVNAANSSLLGGGGVDGAIHRKAGPELAIHCRNLGGCKAGQSKITPGFRLPVRWIIHTVGPFWQDGTKGEPELLASCYRTSLALARENAVRTLAFPAISTGIYKFPKARAAAIAVAEVRAFVSAEPDALDEVIFCAFDVETTELLNRAVEAQTA